MTRAQTGGAGCDEENHSVDEVVGWMLIVTALVRPIDTSVVEDVCVYDHDSTCCGDEAVAAGGTRIASCSSAMFAVTQASSHSRSFRVRPNAASPTEA